MPISDLGIGSDPFPVRGDPAAAMRTLEALLADIPRTKIVSAANCPLHGEWWSLLGSVDYIELRLCPDDRTVDVRSASLCPWFFLTLA